jgi:hypothetical protein
MGNIDRCLEAKGGELEQLYKEGYAVARRGFSDQIHLYAPGMVHFESSFHVARNPLRFPAVSVTGTRCQLQCEHCKGRLLEEMIPATTPGRLYDVCAEVKASGGGGVLISGGSAPDGSVPLDRFLPTIGRVKKEIGLEVVVHTGLVHADVARALASAEIDAAMIDVIGSDETFRSVYHVEGGLASLERTMNTFEEAGVEYAPHVVVGLDNGAIKGEGRAVELISGHSPAAVVVVALMPLEHTPMEHVTPPTPEDVSRVILAARLAMPTTPLLLGCARPRGEAKSRLDILAVDAGVNGIAYPSEEGHEHALSRGLKPQIHDECCALMYRHIRGAR